MKKFILFICFAISITFSYAQKKRIEVKMMECLYQSYDDKGLSLKTLLTNHEQLLIDENILEDGSGQSYLKALEHQLNSKTIKLPSQFFLEEFSKLKSLDVNKRSKCIQDTQKDSLNYDFTSFSKFQKVMSQTESMRAGSPEVARLILTQLKDEDLELKLYKIVFYTIMQSIEKKSGIKRKLPEIEDKQYSEKDLSNALKIHLNDRSKTTINGEELDIKKIKQRVVAYLKKFKSTAIISVSNERETLYSSYISVQNEIIAAYNQVRNELAQKRFGTSYLELTKEQAQEIKVIYPQNLIEGQ